MPVKHGKTKGKRAGPGGILRIGVIGTGSMGSWHARTLEKGDIRRARLAAVCDIEPKALAAFPSVPHFKDSAALIRSRLADAVLIATPHPCHVPIGLDALDHGLHVLMEKPLAVSKSEAARFLRAAARARERGLVSTMMFMTRTDPVYIKMKEIIGKGVLGRLMRFSLTMTDWFRTDAYYRSSGWRATWKGEGGGLLVNQFAHTLDLFQWLLGMPRAVRAFCRLGQWHKIEVEDEVTAYLEYRGGLSGVITGSTAEAPGLNRWEVFGENGLLRLENGRLSLALNRVSALEHLRTSPLSYQPPACKERVIRVKGGAPGHRAIVRNFVDAVLSGRPLLVPVEEGLHQVELANAMLLSSLLQKTVLLPLDEKAFDARLKRLVSSSRPGPVPGAGHRDRPKYLQR